MKYSIKKDKTDKTPLRHPESVEAAEAPALPVERIQANP